MLVYKRLANKAQQQNFAKSRRYCQVTFQFGDREAEPVAFELFHKECPRIVNNFLALLQSGKYLGSPVFTDLCTNIISTLNSYSLA